ncbi:MAG: diaminopimelate decarboxylase [Thermodesulfobacteriota bacterium]
MNHFQYHNDILHCENVSIPEIADAVGTPFYLYSHATLIRHFHAFDSAFDGFDRLVCYSAKANTSLGVLKILCDEGAGLDIVSGGELYKGLKAGFRPETIVYSGVGKRIDEIDFALNTGILMFNIESREELDLLQVRAKALDRTARISIRVNPDVDPKTHPHISTGLKKNKFGIDVETALETYAAASRMDHVEIVGIDCHIGSQITQVDPFEEALNSLVDLIDRLRRMGIGIRYLDMGGGLGITYRDEQPPHPSEYADAIRKVLGDRKLTLVFEPGRVLVGNAGILVTRVLYRKHSPAKEFVITDAAMNDLMRPVLYGAFHDIRPVDRRETLPEIVADVVGPICESGDFLAQMRTLPSVRRGDLLAVMSAGAYGFSMSSNYCSRLRAAEVLVKEDRFAVIRERETYEDLVRKEKTADFWP